MIPQVQGSCAAPFANNQALQRAPRCSSRHWGAQQPLHVKKESREGSPGAGSRARVLQPPLVPPGLVPALRKGEQDPEANLPWAERPFQMVESIEHGLYTPGELLVIREGSAGTEHRGMCTAQICPHTYRKGSKCKSFTKSLNF